MYVGGKIMNAQDVFKSFTQAAPIGLIVMKSAEELGGKIDWYLKQWAGTDKSFIIPSDCPRFQSGDGKGLVKESVRGDDIYIVTDIGNYSNTYKMFGVENHMSPDDHYMDLKRIIQALSGKAHRINVIMPQLYGARQHRRSYRESLDCAAALQELQAMGVSNIVTFDAHDPRVVNAVPLLGVDNVMPTYQVLKAMFRRFPDMKPTKDNFLCVSPDEGAMARNLYYSSVLGVNLGMFYKRRDYSKLVDGRNPIVAHEYLGEPVEGKDIFIADDMIASGDSMLDIAYRLKAEGARNVFCYATYTLFTSGLAKFDKAYEDGMIKGVLGTNLTYRMPELLKRDWFIEVDCSKYISYIIAALNHNMSVGKIIDPIEKIKALLEKR